MVVNDAANSLLMDYAAGALNEPLSLVVASHVATNEEAREKYQALNTVGGMFLEGLEPAEVSEDLLDSILDKLDAMDMSGADQDEEAKITFDAETLAKVPAPLRPYLTGSLDDLRWKHRGGGVSEYPLPISKKGFKASLLKIEPGKSIPVHTHRGREYTVVLDGAYKDGELTVQTGDLVCNDADDVHQPIADAREGCLCLAVLNAPLKFHGPLGWVINPFLKV